MRDERSEKPNVDDLVAHAITALETGGSSAVARICAERLPTYHISGADQIDGAVLHHRPVGGGAVRTSSDWLPDGPVTVGLTAGASTPNNVVGDVIERVLTLRGRTTDELAAG